MYYALEQYRCSIWLFIKHIDTGTIIQQYYIQQSDLTDDKDRIPCEVFKGGIRIVYTSFFHRLTERFFDLLSKPYMDRMLKGNNT